MTRLIALATAELRLFVRNRTAAFTAVIVPMALSCLWLYTLRAHTTDRWSMVIAMQLGVILGFGAYITATSTLVARRQALVLKRLRTSQLSRSALLVGTITPALAVTVVQMAVVAAIDAAAGAPRPSEPLLLLGAAVLGLVLVTTAALATAAITPSAERAGITTLPLVTILVGGAVALTVLDSDAVRQALTVVPGAAIGHLAHLAYGGAWEASVGGLPAALPAIVAILAWPVLFAALTGRYFAWDQRR